MESSFGHAFFFSKTVRVPVAMRVSVLISLIGCQTSAVMHRNKGKYKRIKYAKERFAKVNPRLMSLSKLQIRLHKFYKKVVVPQIPP